MPSAKPQNTLGWIGLQLAEQQRQREAQQQMQIDQERREQNARGQEMGMQMVQHAIDAEDKVYQRKLGLANLLQKASVAEAGKNQRQGKDLEWKTPERDSKIEKNKADTELKGAQKETIGKDDSRADADLEEKRIKNRADYDAKLRTAAMGAHAQMAGKELTPDAYGRPRLQLDSGFYDNMQALLGRPPSYESFRPESTADVPGVSPAAAPEDAALQNSQPPAIEAPRTVQSLFKKPAPRDPNIQPLKPAELGKHAEKANQNQRAAKNLGNLYSFAEKELKDSDFGALGGMGPLNALADAAGAVGKALPGKPGKDLREGTSRRAFFNQGIGLEMAQLVHDFSGAQSAEPEAQRLGRGLGLGSQKWKAILDDGITAFANDKETFLRVLAAAIEWKNRQGAEESQIVRDQGIRIGGEPVPAPDAPPAAQKKRPRRTDPTTGETREWDGSNWVPVQ